MSVAEIEGVEIAYQVDGEGPPLVFMHCWTGNRSFYFEQVARFCSAYRCISFDFPGHGESGEGDQYSIERFGEITEGLMEVLGVEGAVFAGHSLGGMVGLYLALEHPDLVRGLILLDTSSELSGFLLQRVIIGVTVPLGRFAVKPVKAAVAGLVATHPMSSLQAKIISGRECSRTENGVLVKVLDSLGKFNVADRLGEITQPALIIAGKADALADVRHSRVMAMGIPDSTLEVIKGAGHMALFEKPEPVNRAIQDFLNRVYPVTWSSTLSGVAG